VEALIWGVENDASYYDSIYVMSSLKTNSTLLTADDLFLDQASKTINMLHLRDL
jgi:predicted nucleic acid-binding protein